MMRVLREYMTYYTIHGILNKFCNTYMYLPIDNVL